MGLNNYSDKASQHKKKTFQNQLLQLLIEFEAELDLRGAEGSLSVEVRVPGDAIVPR